MANEITHFEIYGDEPSRTAVLYSQIFGWQVERMQGLEYWRVSHRTDGDGPLHDGVTHHAISGLNGLLLYVIAPFDETEACDLAVRILDEDLQIADT